MAKKKKRSSFAGKTASTAAKQASKGASYGYLNLPKDVEVFSVDSKRISLDILPYVISDKKHMDRDEENGVAMPGDLWYKKPFKIHRGIGMENDSFVCPTTIGKRCPICEYRAQRMKAGADRDETDAFKPSLRNLYLIIPKGHKKFEEVPHIWDMSEFLFQKLLNEELMENEEYETFPDLEEGQTLKIRFEEKAFEKNKYYSTTRIDFKERDEQYGEDFLEELPDLDEVLVILSFEKLEAIFLEEDVDDEEEEEEKPKRKKKTTEKKVEEPEEDEDEDDEDDDEDDEDDDEDDDDEEEKEEPTPKKKVTRKKSTTKKSTKNKCPHGHKFGIDADEKDECDECELWDDCVEASEE